MCDPLPRRINGASPPTEPKARTGELTPPGIMLSARCCRRRDCSVLRDMVEGIRSSRPGENRCQQMEKMRTTTIAASLGPNSSDIHRSATALQHRIGNLGSSSYPSNREGFEGQSRGLRTVLFLFLSTRPTPERRVSSASSGRAPSAKRWVGVKRARPVAPFRSPLHTSPHHSPELTTIKPPSYNHPQ